MSRSCKPFKPTRENLFSHLFNTTISTSNKKKTSTKLYKTTCLMEIIYNLSGSNKEKKSSKIKTNFEKISGFSGQELVFRKKKKSTVTDRQRNVPLLYALCPTAAEAVGAAKVFRFRRRPPPSASPSGNTVGPHYISSNCFLPSLSLSVYIYIICVKQTCC